MEFFPNGGFVRLQSRATSNYVHADGDWDSVSLRPLGLGTGAFLEAVWRVEHFAMNQGVFVLLQNAAYGRYLTLSGDTQTGHRGRRAVQADRNEQPHLLLNIPRWWMGERVDPNQDYVRLRSYNTDLLLRGNGRYFTWNTGVTVEPNGRRRLTTMMQWTVHAVQVTAVPIPLPVAPVPPPQPLQIQGRRRGLLFWRRTGNRDPRVQMHPNPGRTIRHVQASDEGDFDPNHFNWPSLTSYDNSVINLRTQLGQLHQNQNQNANDRNGDMLDFTLCIRAGVHARLMPLVTDLPRSLRDMDIVVLRTGSAAAEALEYSQIAAPAQ